MDNKYLTYRGDIKVAVALRGAVVFVTSHPEGQPTAVYRIDADKLLLTSDALPCGGSSLVTDGESLWIGGTDKHVYTCPAKGGALSVRGQPFAAVPIALALLARDRLGVLAGSELHIIARKDGKVLQTLTLPDAGTVLAADPTGQWLVAGTAKGVISVFESEDKANFDLSASDRLHEGAVTALLFEQEELRFLSAGADNKLLSTHARGKLEPEDKGRGANHSDRVTALVWGPTDRFFSGSLDKTVKSWPRVGNARPTTLKDNVIKVTALAVVPLHKRNQLVVICDDNSLRFFALDDEGKFGDGIIKVQDAYARARSELNREEVHRREAALRALASYNDTTSIELIAERVTQDPDHGLRLLATQLLGDSSHPRAPKLLEKCLSHNDEAVRVAAFQGLRKHLGEENLQPLDLALQVDKADIGKLAVQALEKLAAKDDQALARLTDALNVKTWEVRQAALASLEKVYGADSSEANLIALGSKHADLRKLTLIRLFQRKMLTDLKVQAVVRWRGEDADGEVRRTAYLLSLYLRPKLVKALRERDPELHRQLVELETTSQEGTQAKPSEVESALAAVAKKAPGKANLEDADHDPLLTATASRALDTCLRGARGLAMLRDPRAFGLLLQLSREEDTPARVEVARAMAALDDPRSVKRLRSFLFDKEASVRDAAFTALTQLYESEPLRAAESGLTAGFEDVRRRGLQTLLTAVKTTKPTSEEEPTWQLLVRALNDSFLAVRSEAFKAAINLKIGGGDVNTLKFVLQSVHADIRREVLTEVMAQVSKPWAWTLLLTFFNDPDPKLREEAFAFAVKKSKELEPLDAGLCSRYVDVRRSAVQALVKKHTGAAQALLVRTLTDEEKEIRQLALEALILDDAEVALTQALESSHPDVSVRAAKALARHGNSVALQPLLRLATAPEPQQQERQADWAAQADQALEGLAELGAPETLPALIPLLDSKLKYASHRKLAARALMWSARHDTLDTLRTALQHADPQVKYHAALGLAYAGDAFVTSLVFSEEAKKVLTPGERLVAALALGPAGEDQLVVFLDDADENLRNQAMLLLMLLELKDNQGTPSRCLACLSSLMPRVRLTAARALETFSDPAAFLAFVVSLFNDRGEEQDWKISADTVETLAELIARGEPLTRARTALLLRFLSEKEQAAFDQAWNAHKRRFAGEIKTLREQTKQRKPVKPQYNKEQLQQLAFGAYVGLVREQGGAAAKKQQPTLGAQVVRVRQTALNRLLALAQSEEQYARAAVPVMVQAFGDPNQAVRLQAFEHLHTLGMDSATLGAEALEAGHTDLGVKGLEVLTDGAGAKEGQDVLEHVMLTRKDELAVEAAKLLQVQRGAVAVAAKALTAAYEPLREKAVLWLAAEYDKESAAQKQLREALTSRYAKVRESAAFQLATKKDPVAFDALVKMLNVATEAVRQRPVLTALATLGDPRTPDALLDRVENDPTGTALVDELLRGAGNFRRPETAERLLTLMGKNPKWHKAAFTAVVAVSGFDQDVKDPEDEQLDREWEKKQHPRHDAILARLMARCYASGDVRSLTSLMDKARWSRGKDVDPVLADMVNVSDEGLRQATVRALGWRLRKRSSPVEPLLKALQHKDPETQFLAAEGLAKAGRSEGLNVLLTAIDFMTDQRSRARAVLALGELADARALDTLLKHANEEGDPLQDSAAEALGHMGRSDHAGEIFKLLERFSRSLGSVAQNALKGLRWLNTHEGWTLVRQRALDPSFRYRATALEMLGFNDDPATRDLLLRLLATENNWQPVVNKALESARRLWGKDALEPDYALLQNKHLSGHNVREPLNRVCDKGDPLRILELLPRGNPAHKEELARSVINRPELPVAAARKALESNDARTVQLAAQVVGRGGPKGADAGKDIEGALAKWRSAWEQKRNQPVGSGNDQTDEPLERFTACLQKLLWAVGRLGVAAAVLLETATVHPDDAAFRPLRLEAVTALASMPITDAVGAVLEKVAQGNDPEIRTLAAEAIGRRNAPRAEKLADKLLSDRISFNRMTMQEGVHVESTLRDAAGKIHYQGVALPHLVTQGDLPGLVAIVDNRSLPEVTRLGAVEGLAMLAREDAEARLLQIGQSKEEEEEIRKAAWRGLKRSRRARKARHEEKQGAPV